MISHRNVISNTLQVTAFENSHRQASRPQDGHSVFSEVSLGLLPQSHIYSLVVICHAGAYRGDQTIILPKFDLKSYLAAIQNFKITALFLVSLIRTNLNTGSLITVCPLGSSHHHQHAEKPGCVLEVRSEFRHVPFHWCSTLGNGDRCRFPEVVS